MHHLAHFCFGQHALNAIRIFVRRDDLEGGLLLQRRNNSGRSRRVRLIYHRERNAFRPAVFGVHAEDVSENVDEDERDDESERDGHFIGREARNSLPTKTRTVRIVQLSRRFLPVR